MAAIAGKGGSVVCSSAQTMVKNWTVNHTGDALDATSFDSSGVREFVAGLTGWSGNFGANWSTVNNIAVGSSAKGKFRLGSTSVGHLLHGKILITGIAYGCDPAGVVTQDYTFQGSGKLSSTST